MLQKITFIVFLTASSVLAEAPPENWSNPFGLQFNGLPDYNYVELTWTGENFYTSNELDTFTLLVNPLVNSLSVFVDNQYWQFSVFQNFGSSGAVSYRFEPLTGIGVSVVTPEPSMLLPLLLLFVRIKKAPVK